MKKLKINTAAGILDILMAILTAISIPMIFFSAFDEAFDSTGSSEGTTDSIATFFLVAAIAVLILHIVALIKSKKAGFATTGHILGIIASSLFALGAILSLPAFVLYIIAAVFVLKHKRAEE
ncbi:MAG: transporter [Bacilli bacterium]